MGNLFSRSAERWGEGHAQCGVDFVMQNAEPGDMLLFKGVGGSAGFIQWTSPVITWSHVGVILEVEGQLVISEAYPSIIDRDVIRKTRHTGVQTVDLRRRLESYPGGQVAWRVIRHARGQKVTKEAQQKVIDRILAYQEMPQYCSQVGDMLEYGLRTDNDPDVSREGKEFYVCTSWVASVWQDLGIYQKYYTDTETGTRRKRNPGRLLLADIGCEQAYAPFVNGWEAGPIHFIQTPQTMG